MNETDILLVDDDTDRRAALETPLALAGHRCAAARSGSEALSLLGTMRHPPHLILLDGRRSPIEISGLLASLRSDPAMAWIPVVVLAGGEDGRGTDVGTPPGVMVVPQPCAPERILEIVGCFCTRARRSLLDLGDERPSA